MDRLSPSHLLGIKKLQVGCGPKNINLDWWNVDIRHFAGIDEVMDVTTPWPWTDCLDLVYGEHFIEHLAIDRAFLFLVSANMALKTGGKIRLTTPSLEWVLSTHFSMQDDLPHRNGINQTLVINRAFYGWGHRFIYSKVMFETLIKSAGFAEISFCEYGKSEDNRLVNIERHGGYRVQNGYPSVWIVEGTKEIGGINDVSIIDRIHQDFLNHVASGH
jgi:predicted SAM-dependent methyltransferase